MSTVESEKPVHEEANGENNESLLQTTAISAEPEKPVQNERIEDNESSNPTRVEFESGPQNEEIRRDGSDPVHGIQPSRTSMSMAAPGLAGLHTPHRKRRLILFIGVVLATLDLCCLPITQVTLLFSRS
jgi:hypothetical protein